MRPKPMVSNEVLREYAARLDDWNRSYPSWMTSYWRDPDASTHVEVFSYAEYPADLGRKSNYRVAKGLLESTADEGREGTAQSAEQVVEIEGNSSAYGSATVLYVQVYELNRKDKGYTAAFREAVALAEYVRWEYPLLDEDDHSELEDEVFSENLDEALAEARGDYLFDDQDEYEAIVEHACQDLYDLKYQEPDGEVSWIRTAAIYAEHREEYFRQLGNEHLNAPLAGQLALVGVDA
ncbi:hypothetical protein AB0G73_10725 [Streptomyces sp. NPDC020719]|uniref:hypothetical protein n=1 Tax=Streptomyces sp. NPDC020719 TaxID=3154896 RepID=UPI0033DF78C3